MGKFVNKIMKNIAIGILLVTLMGCSSLREPGYIKSNHPYVRKIAGDFNHIVEVTKTVLAQEGWKIRQEVNPSIYERRSGGEDQSQDVLLITESRSDSKIIYATSVYLNVFINTFAEGAEVEVRYQAASPFTSNIRNDKLAKNILDKIEQELGK